MSHRLYLNIVNMKAQLFLIDCINHERFLFLQIHLSPLGDDMNFYAYQIQYFSVFRQLLFEEHPTLIYKFGMQYNL